MAKGGVETSEHISRETWVCQFGGYFIDAK